MGASYLRKHGKQFTQPCPALFPGPITVTFAPCTVGRCLRPPSDFADQMRLTCAVLVLVGTTLNQSSGYIRRPGLHTHDLLTSHAVAWRRPRKVQGANWWSGVDREWSVRLTAHAVTVAVESVGIGAKHLNVEVVDFRAVQVVASVRDAAGIVRIALSVLPIFVRRLWLLLR